MRKGSKMSDEQKRKIGLAHLGRPKTLEHRKNLSLSLKGISFPERKGVKRTEEVIRKIKLGCIGRKSIIHSKQMSLEGNPNWQGGISKEPYCLNWCRCLKEYIKERDNHTCQNPNCSYITQKLCVHHIDYDKKNCEPNNLITLCVSCNGKANFNREYWKEFYSERINIMNNQFPGSKEKYEEIHPMDPNQGTPAVRPTIPSQEYNKPVKPEAQPQPDKRNN